MCFATSYYRRPYKELVIREVLLLTFRTWLYYFLDVDAFVSKDTMASEFFLFKSAWNLTLAVTTRLTYLIWPARFRNLRVSFPFLVFCVSNRDDLGIGHRKHHPGLASRLAEAEKSLHFTAAGSCVVADAYNVRARVRFCLRLTVQ